MPNPLPHRLETAIGAAHAAGVLMRRHLRGRKTVNLTTAHDIKLELDERCQRTIERILRAAHPSVPVLGEEGSDPASRRGPCRWVVDPIDGTVNYFRGIPHAAVSIAHQSLQDGRWVADIGVVHDPFRDETWTACGDGPARCNGRRIRTSATPSLAEAVVSLGFAKSGPSLDAMMSLFGRMVHRVQKIRIMGSAALALVYVADGRLDAYVESGIRLWDIAAGGLILQRAGGVFEAEEIGRDHRYRMRAHNGRLGAGLARVEGRRAARKPR